MMGQIELHINILMRFGFCFNLLLRFLINPKTHTFFLGWNEALQDSSQADFNPIPDFSLLWKGHAKLLGFYFNLLMYFTNFKYNVKRGK